MKLAASQFSWSPFEQPEVYSVLKEYGFSAVEAAPSRVAGPDAYERPAEAAVFAASLAQEYGLAVCSLTGIWRGLIGSIFGAGRGDISEATQGAVRFAKATGAANLVIGGPMQRVMPTEEELAQKGSSVREMEEMAAALFHEWGEYAALHDTCIGLEALPPAFGTNFINATEDAFTMASRADSPGCKVNLDIATLLANGEPFDILRGRVEQINHVHVCEPGNGPLTDWEKHEELAALLREEGYAGFVSLEMSEQPLAVLREMAPRFAEVYG